MEWKTILGAVITIFVIAGLVLFLILVALAKKRRGETAKEENSNGDSETLRDTLKKWFSREEFPVFLIVMGYLVFTVALAYLLPEVWNRWSSTKLFWILWLLLPIEVALLSKKAGPIGKIVATALAIVSFVAFLKDYGGDIKDLWASEEPVLPSQSVQTATAGPTEWTKLRLGEWRTMPFVPDRPFSYSYFGCIEIKYNQENPRLQCDSQSHPEIDLSQSTIEAPRNWQYGGIVREVRVRGISDGASIAFTVK